MPIQYDNATLRLGEHFSLNTINWHIALDQHWVILGANGAGKSALLASLTGEAEVVEGQVMGLSKNTNWVSFEAQGKLIEAERKKDDADILDIISQGTPVKEMLTLPEQDTQLKQNLIESFGLQNHLNSSFRQLSTGETRKVLLIRALTTPCDYLLLDEPFDGLDSHSCEYLNKLLTEQTKKSQIIMVLNRINEIPSFVSHLAYIENQTLAYQSSNQKNAEILQLLHLKTTTLTLPHNSNSKNPPALNPDNPLFRITNGQIRYDQKIIFKNLNWQINKQEHWQITGPNGSGKTGLLNLITGDHPQCYTNDIFVFDQKRGTGESIWQIKQYIGYVSSALQWEYRVSISAKNAIISGFYDSIGLYQKYTKEEAKIADTWIELLALENIKNKPFKELSFGDQRLILIARAMIKQPTLLILDEPCIGLDEINRQRIIALIEKICQETQTTVLYVNHHKEDTVASIKNRLHIENEAGQIYRRQ